MKTKQVEILLPAAVAHGFDYLVPEGMALQVGDIVSVPFGREQSLGVVWGEGKASLPAGKMKQVAQHYAQFPPLSDTMRQFVDWAAWYNCVPKGGMLKMVLPMADIAKEGRMTFDGARNGHDLALAALSPIQSNAAKALVDKLHQGFSVTLLDGVTGSGKTEVYFEMIAQLLAARSADRPALSHASSESQQARSGGNQTYRNQIVILLPEIALSVQWLARFEERFGMRPVVWNSEVTPARKRVAWQAIAKGEAQVVVGARSALFLPYQHLAAIIVDEEHDGSYKQEEGVIYNARDMAVARARFEKIPIVLVSATPSLETYHNVKQGKYAEVSLPARHYDATLPDIEMIDMRNTPLDRGAFIAQPLRQALADALQAGHQSLLFLNRRGYAPLMLCRACGHRFQCPQCTGWMVVHKKKKARDAEVDNDLFAHNQSAYLQCHHCSYTIPMPSKCPACGAEDSLHACGPGVERVLEEVQAFLPQARVAVMASDHLTGPSELSDTITAMGERNIDLLIGTQMVAKGHHFAGLSTIGVVDADLGLAGGDLRAAEHTYQLLHQLSGRAGRETISGRVYLQSFLPDHPVMKALVSGDRNAFLAAELQARQNAAMPPFTRLAALIVEGEKEEMVLKTAKTLAASFPQFPNPSIHLYGPAPAPLYMLRGKFRYRLLVKADRSINLPDTLRAWVENQTHPTSIRIKIDIDPHSFM